MNYISKENYELLSQGKFIEGDILFCLRGSLGKFAVIKSNIYGGIASSLVIVRPKENVTIEFLAYYFQSKICNQMVEKYKGGAAQPNLGAKDLSRFDISFPPVPEQNNIVAILDKAFENITKAKENVEKNLKNAKEIFDSYLQSVFENNGEGWEERKLEELGDKKNAIISGPFGSNLKVKDYTCEGIPLIRLQNIGKGYFINKNIKYVSIEKAEQLKSHSFIPGDVVLAKLGIPIGKTCIIPTDFKAGIIVADIVRIRLNTKIVDYNFLEYYLNTNIAVSQLNKNVSGATRPRVNLSDVREIKIHLPPLTQQKQIVLQLDQLSSKTKSLERINQKKLQDLGELKKSILQKAFNGELTEC
jgi:type I restriction enzyme S subunit